MWVRAPPPALFCRHLKGGGSRTHGACRRLHVGGAASLAGLRSLLGEFEPHPRHCSVPTSRVAGLEPTAPAGASMWVELRPWRACAHSWGSSSPTPGTVLSHLKGGGSRTHGACRRLHVGGAASLAGLRSLLGEFEPHPRHCSVPTSRVAGLEPTAPAGASMWVELRPWRACAHSWGSSSPTPGTPVFPPQGTPSTSPRRPAPGKRPFGIPSPASLAPSSPSAFWNRLHPRIIGAVSRCCAPAAPAAGPHPAPPEMHPYGRSTRPLEFQPGFRSRRHR
jgi:hypothetical protein